jgi:RNA polymerase sigma-70 factor (ECF subfamily)
LLEKGSFHNASREKGRFRSWLLGALNHFLVNEWQRGQTLKRGGQVSFVSLDDDTAEKRYLLEPATDLTPERLYERRWVQALLDQVLARLREQFTADGKEDLFDHLRIFLTDVKGTVSFADVAAKMDMREDAVKQAVLRLRRRYRELLRREIAHTVSTPAEVEDEIRHLFELFER